MKRKIQNPLPRAVRKPVCFLLALVFAALLSLPVSALPLSTGDSGKDLLHILLVGQDSREDETAARADCIMLCSFHKKTKQLTVTSFLRDLYLPIPGHGKNRINAAYALGGTELLQNTIETTFALEIDGTVEMDFDQFAGIIDLLGGVPLDLRADEAKLISKETGTVLEEGQQTLNGQQALAYSRIRKLDPDGDLSRTHRQRKVIGALLDCYKAASTRQMLSTLSQLLPMLSTNMSQGQLLLCALEVLPHLSDLQIFSQSVPGEGSYWDETIDGMAVLVTDLEQARAQLHSSLIK